jgi:hypothetical protein
VDLNAVLKNKVPDWIEGHEHAPDELAVVKEDTHSHESDGRGKAHDERCRRVVALLGPGRGQPAQGGADWTVGRGTAGGGWVLGVGRPRHGTVEALLSAEQQGRGSSGRVRLDGAGTTDASRKGAPREQEGRVGSCGCRARSSLRSARRHCWHLGATVGARGRRGAAGPRRSGPAWGRWRLDVGFLARVGTGSARKSAGAAAGAGSRVEKGDARIWWSRVAGGDPAVQE